MKIIMGRSGHGMRPKHPHGRAADVVVNMNKKSFHELIGEQGQSLEEELFVLLLQLKKANG